MLKINLFLEKNFNKIVIWMLLINPIVDLLTSICLHFFDKNVTFGVIIRITFMVLCIYYLFFVDKNKYIKIYLILFIVYQLLFGLIMLLNYDFQTLVFNIKNSLKVFYFPILLITFYQLFKNKKLEIKNNWLIYVLIIYSVFILIPLITNTGFNSYADSKKGSIGWFSATNEIGGIFSLLLPFLIIFIKDNKDYIKKIVVLLLFLISIFAIGTKVPILSLIIFIFGIFIWLLILFIKNKQYSKLGILSLMLVLLIGMFLLIIPRTTFYENIKIHLKFLKIHNVSEIVTDVENIDHFIFSQRIKFYLERRSQYLDSNWTEKLIGIGYDKIDNKDVKLVEMDYYDIFFNQGLIGFIIFFIPLIILIKINYQKIIKNINFEKYMYIVGSILILILALFSGHIITAPSVSIYSSLIITLLMNYKGKEVKNEIRNNNC